MPLYLCRWTNGDCSFVFAANKGEAIERLDEVGNAEGCPLIPIHEFMAHFCVSDAGEIEFEGLGKVTEDVTVEKACPILDEAMLNAPRDGQSGALTPEGVEAVRAAVARERERVRQKKVPEPETLLGQEIKRTADAPTRLVDRIIRTAAIKGLERFPGSGKPQ
jgi:hypothetical protein